LIPFRDLQDVMTHASCFRNSPPVNFWYRPAGAALAANLLLW